MFSRLRFVRPLLKKRQELQISRFKTKWADGGEHATHNDLPVPEGNWKEYYTRRNLVNNLVLISGSIALIVAVSLVFNSGHINFNFSPPDHYEADAAECNCDAHAKKD